VYPVPSPSLSSSFTHTHRSIGYHNHNPHLLTESSTRLMYLRVYDIRDSSCEPECILYLPRPYALAFTHAHRSIGYRNRNPQILTESSVRLMYLRVYGNRDSSHHPAPSPSLCSSLTYSYRSIGYHNRNPQPLDESTVRLMYSRVHGNRDSSRQTVPSPSLCYLLTHAHSTLSTTTLLTITYT
jgi:hypothetical protein